MTTLSPRRAARAERVAAKPAPTIDDKRRAEDAVKHLPDMLTLAQVADFLQMSPDHVRRYVRSGELISVRMGRNRNSAIRVYRSCLAQWLWQGQL